MACGIFVFVAPEDLPRIALLCSARPRLIVAFTSRGRTTFRSRLRDGISKINIMLCQSPSHDDLEKRPRYVDVAAELTQAAGACRSTTISARRSCHFSRARRFA